MAITKSATNTGLKSTAGNKGTLKVTFTEADLTEKNKTNNTSTITASASFTQVTGNYSSYAKPYLRLYWYDDNEFEDGVELVNENVTAISKGETVTISLTFDVTHNEDGSLTGYAQAKWEYDGTGTLPCQTGYATTAETTLATVPRATTPTLEETEYELGQPITINTPRASDVFTHKLYYQVGDSAKILFAKDVETSYVWEDHLSLANWITSSDSATVTIYCQTYNGETYVGEKSVTFKGLVPETIVPTIETFDISEYVTDVADKVGVYVQGKSQLSINASAKGRYGATITSYKIEANGETFNTNEALTSLLKDYGTQEVVLTVTDSRSRTTTQTIEIDVKEYYAPKAWEVIAQRCDPDGTLNEDGVYLRARVTYDVAPIDDLNEINVYLQYLNEDDEWINLYTISEIDGSYFVELKSYYSYKNFEVETFSADSNHQIRLLVEDGYSSDTYTATLYATFSLINFHKDGKALCFGRACQREEAVEFALPMYDEYDTKITNGLATEDETIDADTTLENLVVTKTNTPNSEMMYVHTSFVDSKKEESDRSQLAIPYEGTGELYFRNRVNEVWSEWKDVGNLDVIGDLANLETTDTSSIVSAINSIVQNMSDIDNFLFDTNGYIRFTNGFQIAWTYANVTAGGTQWTDAIYYSDHTLPNWEAAFTSLYSWHGNVNSSVFWASFSAATSTSSGKMRCFRPTNGTAAVGVYVVGYGKWK